MQIASVQAELFLDSFHLGIGGLIVPDVQLTANHVGDEDSQGLGCTTGCTNRACKMYRNKLRAVHVVEQTYLADAFQGCDQDRFGQDREANSEADIDGFLKVVALFSKTPGYGLCDDDGGCFTVVLIQQCSDIIGDLVALKMFDEEFFCSPCQIGCAGNLNPVFVVKPKLSGLFCDPVGVIGPFVKPPMVGQHLAFETLQIQA